MYPRLTQSHRQGGCGGPPRGDSHAAVRYRSAMDAQPAPVSASKNQPDIRLLGRLLGDVVSEQHGSATLALVEEIRRQSIGDYRSGADLAVLGRRIEGI